MSRTATVLLLSGDYADRLDVMYREADRLERDAALDSEGPRRIAHDADLVRAREAYEALKAEAEEAGTRVVLRSLTRSEWRKLKRDHPARSLKDGDTKEQADADQNAGGVNAETVEDDLLFEALVEPKFDRRSEFDEWVDEISEGDFQVILQRAWVLAVGARIDPKSLRSSATGNFAES